jgi:hypothetical protein
MMMMTERKPMATKKKTKTKHKKKSIAKPLARKSALPHPKGRICTVCHKRGHNKRSHEPGGRLAR